MIPITDFASVTLSFLVGLSSGLISLLIYHIRFAAKVSERLASIETKLNMICKEVDELKKRVDNMDSELRRHGERLAMF